MAKAKPEKIPVSQPDKVDAYIAALDHPLRAELQALREIILSAHNSIGEHIKWNHPAFFYTGELEAFDPKDYKRDLVVTNLHSKEGGVLLVFWGGGAINDTTGFLTGDYPDGRRLARFHSMEQVNAGKKSLIKVVKAMVKQVGS